MSFLVPSDYSSYTLTMLKVIEKNTESEYPYYIVDCVSQSHYQIGLSRYGKIVGYAYTIDFDICDRCSEQEELCITHYIDGKDELYLAISEYENVNQLIDKYTSKQFYEDLNKFEERIVDLEAGYYTMKLFLLFTVFAMFFGIPL